MSLKMSEKSREEVLILMRERYKKRGRKGRSKLIDDFCAMCGYERKYAIKLLGSKRRVEGKLSKRGGAHAKYGDAEATVLKTIWQAAEQPCKIRLKAALPLWLPHFEAEHGGLEAELRERLLAISPATIERLLSSYKASVGSCGRCGTRPGTLLRRDIPVRTEHWDVAGPGWVEAEKVWSPTSTV